MFPSFEISDPRFESEGLRQITVQSPALRQRVDLTVFRPEEAIGQQDVPIVILLHGAYGSHWHWCWLGGAHRTLQAGIRRGEYPPLILAMPSDGLWGPGSGYVPHKEKDFERWIIEEVPVAVHRALPETSPLSSKCIAGLSMGGFGAMRLGGKYPKHFRAISGHSSVTDREQLGSLPGCDLRTWSDRPEDSTVFAAWRNNTGPHPRLRFDCGLEDSLLEPNRKLHRELVAAGIPHEYTEFPGGHEWSYWEKHLVETLQFFSATLKTS